MKDYYSILKVTKDAEISVIKLVFHQLSKLYHPDTWAGSKKEANDRQAELNEAKDTLLNPSKKKKYDEEYEKQNFGNYKNFNSSSDTSSNTFKKTVSNPWKVIIDVFPEAEERRTYLYSLSPILGQYYQVELISSKTSARYESVYQNIKDYYFYKYFGDQLEAHEFVEDLMLEGHNDVVTEIQDMFNIMGSEASEMIIKRIKEKHSHIFKVLKRDWHKQYNNDKDLKKTIDEPKVIYLSSFCIFLLCSMYAFFISYRNEDINLFFLGLVGAAITIFCFICHMSQIKK